MNKGRRIAVVPLDWDVIVEALLPPGTRIEDATFNFIRMTVDLVVSHPELPVVDPGAVPPAITPQVVTRTAVIEREVECWGPSRIGGRLDRYRVTGLPRRWANWRGVATAALVEGLRVEAPVAVLSDRVAAAYRARKADRR